MTLEEFMTEVETKTRAFNIQWGLDRDSLFGGGYPDPNHMIRTFYRGVKCCPISFLSNIRSPSAEPVGSSEFGKAAMRLGLGEDYLSLIRASDNTMLPDSEIEFELRTRMLNLIER